MSDLRQKKMNLNIKDTRGKESITLTLVVTACAILFLKYLVSGASLGPLGVQSAMTGIEFGTAFALCLAPWLQREWVEKTKVTP